MIFTTTIFSSGELLLDLVLFHLLMLMFILKSFNRMEYMSTELMLIMTLMHVIIKEDTSLLSLIDKRHRLINCIVNVGVFIAPVDIVME